MNISILDSASLGADMDLSLFADLGQCSIWPQTSKAQLEERIKDCDVIISNRVILGAEELALAPSLKLIALTATGVNTVDLEECSSRGIGVANVCSYSTDSVAQHTFSMLLYLLEQTRYYDDYVRKEGYRRDQRFADVSRPWTEISGKTWGIIGLGDIGRKVATIASAFGAEPVYYSTSGIDRDEEYRRLNLEEICAQSDIISIHAPLNENTRLLLGSDEFSLMKDSAYLVNAGRGAIIDEPALAQALKDGKLMGASLDVLTDEPPHEDNPLLPLIGEKLLITPHNAWGSIESRKRLINEVYENIKAFYAGIRRNRVD
ncbi:MULTISPECIES: D-2-hydroxyacid dehydrogenase [unclassified Oceanispirochaeta]|uniref:D-2-hydroxyacid dehydrogenase n=1 Tax=unclassified Oceanispirochaeta TaxID=2635722 RepID=UPI000E097F3F|nr:MULTISPECIES: D-2-hydroxyacid dehydrogenase [unclassified Oceanispirochaeta]MBF9015621.1 D-2-hydroxyacid dehydrogenase [Oceanispirochaeta sp. M2]NPD73395.1 D-2-hydroxyacid dehydrogenase [Oceanispirochaeta sp. M1]RDG30869.1 D-2-hydroxyacid dehydrogenase [Oceanispirochaeta sp. M1]